MKGILITTKRDLTQILEDVKDARDNEQFTLNIEKCKGLVYWRIQGE